MASRESRVASHEGGDASSPTSDGGPEARDWGLAAGGLGRGIGDAGPVPPPGQQAVVLAALMIGLLLMGIQLWLLTVALELYLAGAGGRGWLLALVSGLIFLGGLLVLRLLGRRPHLPARGAGVTDVRADW